MYKLELLLYERIKAVMDNAVVPFNARMTVCSKVCGRPIFQWNDLTPEEAIQVIDYITKETVVENKNRRKHKKANPTNGARGSNSGASVGSSYR